MSAPAVMWLSADDRAWSRQLVRWQVDGRSWVAAVGPPFRAAVLTTTILSVVGGPVDFAAASVSPVLFVVVFAVAMTVSAGLYEEPDWRGFAQPPSTSAPERARSAC